LWVQVVNDQQVCLKQANNYNPDFSGTIKNKMKERKTDALRMGLLHVPDFAKFYVISLY
jgi:hypothetical protein